MTEAFEVLRAWLAGQGKRPAAGLVILAPAPAVLGAGLLIAGVAIAPPDLYWGSVPQEPRPRSEEMS